MDNRRWVYLLLASTLSGWGFGEMELGEALAAVPHILSRYAEKDLNSGAASTIENFALTQLCADAQTKLAITAEQCTIEMICTAGILLRCKPGIDEEGIPTGMRDWNARSYRELTTTGSFTPNEPL